MVRLATIPAQQLLAETRAALLLVDVTNRFIFGNETAPAPTARVLPALEALLGAARRHGIPRFFVTVADGPGAHETAPWLRRRADMGADIRARAARPAPPAWGNAIPAAIAPLPDEVHLTKRRTSAFYETSLELLLRGAGIETVVLGGVASYGCIIATYIDAYSRGFFPLLCTDAVDGADAAMHAGALAVMGATSRLRADDVVAVWSGARTAAT